MLFDFLKENLGPNVAPFAAIALFVVVVGVSLWLTPRLARWIDSRRNKSQGFFDGMMEKPTDDKDQE